MAFVFCKLFQDSSNVPFVYMPCHTVFGLFYLGDKLQLKHEKSPNLLMYCLTQHKHLTPGVSITI